MDSSGSDEAARFFSRRCGSTSINVLAPERDFERPGMGEFICCGSLSKPAGSRYEPLTFSDRRGVQQELTGPWHRRSRSSAGFGFSSRMHGWIGERNQARVAHLFRRYGASGGWAVNLMVEWGRHLDAG